MAIDNSLASGLRKRFLREMSEVELRIRAGVEGARKTRPGAHLKEVRRAIERIRTPWVLRIAVHGKAKHQALHVIYVGQDLFSGSAGGIAINHLSVHPATGHAAAQQFYIYCTAHAFERIIQASDIDRIGIWVSNVLGMAAGAAMHSADQHLRTKEFRLFAVDEQQPPNIKAVIVLRLDEPLGRRLDIDAPVYGIRTVIPGGERLDPRYEREFRKAEVLPDKFWSEQAVA